MSTVNSLLFKAGVLLQILIMLSLYFNFWSVKYEIIGHNASVCKHPVRFFMQDDSELDYLILSIFEGKGFNANCSLKTLYSPRYKQYKHCRQYNGKSYSKYYCNGSRYDFVNIDQKYVYGLHVSDKYTLSAILNLYCQLHAQQFDNVCNFMLSTYEIDNEEQRTKFIKKHINCSDTDSNYNKTWVFKENIHSGQGVHFVNNYQLIYRLIAPNKTEQSIHYNKECSLLKPGVERKYLKSVPVNIEQIENTKISSPRFRIKREKLLIQEFISNPLLIENKAFHLREYLLIASYSPLIVLSYPEAIIYRNPNDFDREGMNVNTMKTNAFIGEQSAKIKNENGEYFHMYWGLQRFQRYLNEVYGEKLLNYTTDKLPKDINRIIKHVFNANMYYNKLKNWSFNETNKFDENIDMKWYILCMDISITDSFELKLMEVNTNCGTPCEPYLMNSDSKEEFDGFDNNGCEWMCEKFAKDAVDILSQVYEKRHDKTPIKNIDSLGRFEIAFMENIG